MNTYLDCITFGLATARRGWIEPEDVIYTLGTSKLLWINGMHFACIMI